MLALTFPAIPPTLDREEARLEEPGPRERDDEP